MAILMMIGDGAASYMSLRMGHGDSEKAANGIGNAVTLGAPPLGCALSDYGKGYSRFTGGVFMLYRFFCLEMRFSMEYNGHKVCERNVIP